MPSSAAVTVTLCRRRRTRTSHQFHPVADIVWAVAMKLRRRWLVLNDHLQVGVHDVLQPVVAALAASHEVDGKVDSYPVLADGCKDLSKAGREEERVLVE